MPHAVAVTYYHSVGRHVVVRPKSFLSIEPRLFEEQVKRLLRWGYSTVTLQDVHDHVAGVRLLEGRNVVLTFDDGFLDNWVRVFPLARKLGFRFTVFVNPEFVDPREIVRPTLEDVWAGRAKEEDLEWWGYLSWPEMRQMEASGLVDVQSHALTHTWHHSDPEVIDFHHPGSPYHWLAWNAHPEAKPFFLSAYDETVVPYGTPVHRFRKAIQARRWWPDPQLGAVACAHVAANGGRGFFDRPDWRQALLAVYGAARAQLGDSGRFETDEQHRARITTELVESKRRIEAALSKEVRFICWPGGSETAFARRIALESGYWATTKGTEPNAPGGDPTHISRVACWFEMRAPKFVKWWVFRAQMERGLGRRTPSAMAARILARLKKLSNT